MFNIPEFTLVRSKRRTLALYIQPDGKLLVKAPLNLSKHNIEQFVEQQSELIAKRRMLLAKRALQREENQYLFLGQILTLTCGNYKHISVAENRLLFPISLLFRKEKELTAWYVQQAKQIITEQAKKYAEEMQTNFRSITFSDTKSQWGRCSKDNRLQFNWRLVMAPILVINYVVIHELAHTIVKDHSQIFWMKVRKLQPSYRQQIKWLKENGDTLF
ncbi:MAG: hypothetical protein KatS3mg089_0741 [Patescibacteria group bacterium]|nr:MAG: hypothetical protein KatS3mg089_0741 [Patescibacteria group bacterium]